VILEGPRAIAIACQDPAQVKVFSDELLKLVNDGHFYFGKRGCGMGGLFWGFTWDMGGGFYAFPRTLGILLEF